MRSLPLNWITPPAFAFAALLTLYGGSALAQDNKLNGKAMIKQVAHGINSSALAVACHLRPEHWQELVMIGYKVSTRVRLLMEFQNADDASLDAVVEDIITGAKVAAALDARFGAPSPTQCQTLQSSKEIEELDATAKMGLLFNAVKPQ
jgi:hypothetical protein